MRFAVVGAGGVGGWLGARLQQAGCRVVWIARGATHEALLEKGLTLKCPGDEDLHLDELVLYHDAVSAAASGEVVDCCILATKASQLKEAASSCASMLSDAGFVLTVQNGVEAPHDAAEVLGYGKVVAGSARCVSVVLEPSVIEFKLKPHNLLTVGEVFRGEGAMVHEAGSDRVRRLKKAFEPVQGVSFAIGPDSGWGMWWELYDKAIVMCTNGLVSAAARAPLDVLYTNPTTKVLARSLMLEIASIADANGCILADSTEEFVDEQLSDLGSTVIPGTTVSSTREVLMGQPSEVLELAGSLVRSAERVGMQAPISQTLLALLTPQELRARGELQYNLNGVPGGVPHVVS